jgi:hypothetical protein
VLEAEITLKLELLREVTLEVTESYTVLGFSLGAGLMVELTIIDP